MFGAIRVVGKKILFAFLTYVIINLFIFIVPRLMPGNYIDYLASTRFLPREAVEELYIRFGLMDPLHIQLLRYVSNVMFSLPPILAILTPSTPSGHGRLSRHFSPGHFFSYPQQL
jgi:ABC-type dipeptide/oligopeptide/nickel transport system permease component